MKINSKKSIERFEKGQINIIKKYVKEHGFLPPKKAFMELGGDMSWVIITFGTYEAFYIHCGYSGYVCRYGYAKKYKVIDDGRGGKVIFTGTFKQVYNKYFTKGFEERYIWKAISMGTKILGRYYVVREDSGDNDD